MSPAANKGDQRNKLLTDTELELMNLLWQKGEATVRDLLAALAPQRVLAYTSVSTMMRILEQKQVVGSRKQGRGHIYFPLVAKPEYEHKSLNHLVDHVFQGRPSALVNRLLDAEDLSSQELDSIRKLIDGKLKEHS